MKPQLTDKWALVTGASSGIGEEFAHQLACKGMHLILTARRESRLKELAEKLFQLHGTKTVIIPADLSQAEAVDSLIAEIRKLPDPVTLVINNAGFGNVSSITNSDLKHLLDIVEVNISVVTRLTYEFLPDMIARNDGGVINVSSVTAFQPVPYMSVYAASKAYVLHLSEALWAELYETDVRILALCPGPTKTEFFDKAGAASWLSKTFAHTSSEVVSKSLRYYERSRPICIPGIKNWLLSFVYKHASRKRVVWESRKVFHNLATGTKSKAKADE